MHQKHGLDHTPTYDLLGGDASGASRISRDGHPVTDEALLRDERRHSTMFRSGLALSLVAALGDGVVMLLILVAMLAVKHAIESLC